jgi:predicted transcriptional regulator
VIAVRDEDIAISVWDLADLATPMAVRVAATLRLADHIAEGVTDPAALARTTGVNEDALRRVMHHLARAGVLRRTGPEEYALTATGSQLLDSETDGFRAWLDIRGAIGRADLSFFGLLDSVSTGQAAYDRLFGVGFWEDLDRTPELSASFDRLMGEHPAVSDLIDGYDWSRVRRVADVGGGDGTALAALLTACPQLSGMLVERAGPAAAAREVLARAGVASRADVVTGSFFDPVPAGADVYVLSRVINDWDNEHAIAILRGCAEAAGTTGEVIVLEEGFPAPGEVASTDMDLRMLVFCAGRDRSLDDLNALGEQAGLVMVREYGGLASTLVAFATVNSDEGSE